MTKYNGENSVVIRHEQDMAIAERRDREMIEDMEQCLACGYHTVELGICTRCGEVQGDK